MVLGVTSDSNTTCRAEVSYSGLSPAPTEYNGSSKTRSSGGPKPEAARGLGASPSTPSAHHAVATPRRERKTPRPRADAPLRRSRPAATTARGPSHPAAPAPARSRGGSRCARSADDPLQARRRTRPPSRRGATTRGSPRGAAASSSNTSEVSLDPTWMMTQASSREDPMPIQKRSSGSSNTRTSLCAGAPTSWRQT